MILGIIETMLVGIAVMLTIISVIFTLNQTLCLHSNKMGRLKTNGLTEILSPLFLWIGNKIKSQKLKLSGIISNYTHKIHQYLLNKYFSSPCNCHLMSDIVPPTIIRESNVKEIKCFIELMRGDNMPQEAIERSICNELSKYLIENNMVDIKTQPYMGEWGESMTVYSAIFKLVIEDKTEDEIN